MKKTGKLIYLMGSSGAGKDTLLNEIKSRKIEDIFIAQRHITRKVTSDEQHFPLSEQAFHKNIQQRRYAMYWFANGYGYGIESLINIKIAQGKTVIVNGSREYYPLAKQLFSELIGICLIVDSSVLQQRLRQRNRESAEEISARLQRNDAYHSTLPSDVIRLTNHRSIIDTADRFLHAIEVELSV